MKKIYFFAMACLAICLASCNGFKSQKWDLADGIYAATSLGENGDTLCGVFKADGTELIAPQANVKFSTDRDYRKIIIALPKDPTGPRNYYTLAGKQITDGPIRGFKVPGTFTQLVFMGVQNGQTVIYFPEGEEVILTKSQFIDHQASILGYQIAEGFVIRSLKSNDIYVSEEKDAYFVACDGNEPTLVVPGKKTATVYDLKGEKVKDLPLKTWTQALKKAKLTKLEGITLCRVDKAL